MNAEQTERRPPRGPSTKSVLIIVGLLIGAVATGIMLGPAIRSAWHEIAHADEHAGEADGQWYACGMHPWVIQPGPGLCPICHMDLTPIDPAKLSGEIAIDPVMVQNIGVRVAPVEVGPLVKTIRTVGTVEMDPRLTRDVVVRTEGLIQKLYTNYEGAHVEHKQVLADFHSPEAVAAGYELAAALRSNDSVIRETAEQKLRILGVPDETIELIGRTGEVPQTFPIRSPIHGVLMMLGGHEGHWLEKGEDLAEIANHSKVWVIVSVYERDLPLIKLGQRATMSLAYTPGRVFEGKVTYIDPHVNEEARQARVRLEFDNPELLLKPGMFAEVQLKAQLADSATLIPRSAVIDTGTRRVVFVNLGEGRFEPRDVKLGLEPGDGTVQVLSGLKAEEQVVVSGQFLLDSEAKFREGLLKMVKGTMAVEPPKEARSELSALPPEAERHLAEALTAYFEISAGLADDDASNLTAPAKRIADQIGALRQVKLGDEHFWHKHGPSVQTVLERASTLADAKDLKQARIEFGHLSPAIEQLLQATGVPQSYGQKVDALVCGMAKDVPQKGLWLQSGSEVRNPYMGQRMLRCQSKRYTLPVTGDTAAPSQEEQS